MKDSLADYKIKRLFQSLDKEERRKILGFLLRGVDVETLIFLLEESGFMGYSRLVNNLILTLLEKKGFYATVARFLEQITKGEYYAPEIVKAAQYYEKLGDIKKALELYQEGIEKCDPRRLQTYDENTGGYVNVLGNKYAESLYAKEIEESYRFVEMCRKKVKELKRKLQKNKKRKNTFCG